ncbi:MAG: glycosyl transferase [Clostridia bacterium]|nr:glycosyl transferase [Clostridia bacterium]
MIPKIIHYCWVGGNPLPDSAKKCIRSWKKHCPGYKIIEWNESNYDFTQAQYMKEAYEAKKWGFVPDYARLDIIYKHGGIYLDVDVEIVKSFDPLLELPAFAGFQDENNIALGLGFGAEAGNPVIGELRDSYSLMHFIRPDGTFDTSPSPMLNTRTLVDKYGVILNGEYQEFPDITVFPPEYFCPKSFADGIIRKTENTYSIHHFDASWFTEEGKKRLADMWEHKQKRSKKLAFRKKYGGFFRKVFGDERWEKMKSLFIRG